MANVKLKAFLERVLQRLLAGMGWTGPCENIPGLCKPCSNWTNRAVTHLNPWRIQDGFADATPIPASGTPIRPAGTTSLAHAYLENCSHH